MPVKAQSITSKGRRSLQALWQRRRWMLALLLLVPVSEAAGHLWLSTHVPSSAAWTEAGQFVASNLEPEDLVLARPAWTEPLVRSALGSALSLRQAGFATPEAFERVWLISLDEARPADADEAWARKLSMQPPEIDRQFGRVRVRRWDIDSDPVLYDLVRHVPEAHVTMDPAGSNERCRWVSRPDPKGGGLFAGPAVPAQRFVCDPRRPWLWVAPTVIEDLKLQPRYCVWQHPSGPEPIRVRFSDVPLGHELVLHAGLYYDHERRKTGGPVHLTVRIDDETAGQMTHRDGEGWKRSVIQTQTLASAPENTAQVSIDVSAPNPQLRTLCWSAFTRVRQSSEGLP